METGVYAIRNKINGKSYIGSAAQTFEKRWAVHRHYLRQKKHHSIHLQRAWDKYGADAFEFVVLERVAPLECVSAEQRHIDSVQSAKMEFGYNIAPTAGSLLGSKRTPEQKERIRQQTIRLNSIRNLRTPEAKAKMISKQKERRGRKVSKEISDAMSARMKALPPDVMAKIISRLRAGMKPQTEEFKRMFANNLRGKKKSLEWRTKIGQAHAKIWREKPEWIRALIAAGRARMTPEQKKASAQKISNARKEYWKRFREERGMTHTFREVVAINKERRIVGLPLMEYVKP